MGQTTKAIRKRLLIYPGMPATQFISASAAIVFVLGLVHLVYTVFGSKLHPRDPQVKTGMMACSPGISRETTMWLAWVGFNASQSFSAILFGAVYGYLATLHGSFLLQSWFLLAVGFLLLVGYAVLGRMYWFSVPFRCIALVAGLYAAGLTLSFV